MYTRNEKHFSWRARIALVLMPHVAMCWFFMDLPPWCSSLLLYTTRPFHHIFIELWSSWSPSSQLLILSHFLGVRSQRTSPSWWESTGNMDQPCFTDIPVLITHFTFLSPTLLVVNMSSPPCRLHPKPIAASARPTAPPLKPLRAAFCLQIHVSAPFFFLSAPFSSVINSNRHGPPTIPHHCFAANCLTLSCPFLTTAQAKEVGLCLNCCSDVLGWRKSRFWVRHCSARQADWKAHRKIVNQQHWGTKSNIPFVLTHLPWFPESKITLDSSTALNLKKTFWSQKSFCVFFFFYFPKGHFTVCPSLF